MNIIGPLLLIAYIAFLVWIIRKIESFSLYPELSQEALDEILPLTFDR